jgi:thiamine-phosphate pyrophosphorylase
MPDAGVAGSGGRRLDLPRLILVADGFTDAGRAARVEEAVRAGVPWVHLRDHEASAGAFEAAARALVLRWQRAFPGLLVSVNSRVDGGVVRRPGIGLHLGWRGPSVESARQALGAEALVGFSAHSVAEGRQAVAAGADYLFYSPVFATSSKPGEAGTGLEGLRDFCRAVDASVYALGGVTPERVARCLEAGACGVAVLSGILEASDPSDAVGRYRCALDAYLPDPYLQPPRSR